MLNCIFGILDSVGNMELILILAIALVLFGPGKLPEMAKSLGKALTDFQKASVEIRRQVEDEIKSIETEDTKGETEPKKES